MYRQGVNRYSVRARGRCVRAGGPRGAGGGVAKQRGGGEPGVGRGRARANGRVPRHGAGVGDDGYLESVCA